MMQIRLAQAQDIQRLVEIWLQASVLAHNFIAAEYWHGKQADMQNLYLPMSKNYVLTELSQIHAFAAVIEQDEPLLAALFVEPTLQGQGYGSALLNHLKTKYSALTLNVYAENQPSVEFYLKQQFVILAQDVDEHTGHAELTMRWARI